MDDPPLHQPPFRVDASPQLTSGLDKLAMSSQLFDDIDPFGLDSLLELEEPWFSGDLSGESSSFMPTIKREQQEDDEEDCHGHEEEYGMEDDEEEYGDCLSSVASSPLTSPPSPIATITISSEELFLNSHSSMELHNYSSSRSTRSGSKSTGSPSSSTSSSPNARKSNGTAGRGSGRGKPITELSLTEEEKRLLSKEGYAEFPAGSIPLTKLEEKILRKVRRKIRNKRSAQCSRQRKKEYVEELEKKFEKSISENDVLRKEVLKLKRENNNLLVKMRNLVTGAAGQTSLKTSFFVLVLSFLLVLVPFFRFVLVYELRNRLTLFAAQSGGVRSRRASGARPHEY